MGSAHDTARILVELSRELGRMAGLSYEIAAVLRQAGLDAWAHTARTEARSLHRLAAQARGLAVHIAATAEHDGPRRYGPLPRS